MTRLFKSKRTRRRIKRRWLIAAATIPACCGVFVWAITSPGGPDAIGARLGISALRSWVSGIAMAGMAAVMIGSIVGVIGQPWRLISRVVRPFRRCRVWPYHAANHGLGPPDFLDILTQEHARRVEFWRRRLRDGGGRRRTPLLYALVDPAGRRALGGALVLYFLLVSLPRSFGLSGPESIARLGCWTGALFPLLMFSPWVIGATRYAAATRRLLRTLEHSRCPDCSYDLLGVPPALPKDKVPGAGPARCPECGSMWPLVPPPFDID